MKKLFAIPALALLSACADGVNMPDFRGGGSGDTGGAAMTDDTAMAPMQPMVATERLIAAAESNGCVINQSTIVPIMQQAAIGTDELAGVVSQLEADGRAVPDGETAVRIVSSNCTA